MENEKRELIEELGVYFENNEGIPPLSARIFSLLVLSDKDGVTFEEIVEKLETCKSSVSTNLQLLQTAGLVYYSTKPGDRKRYFRIEHDSILTRLEKKIELWEKEKELHHKIYRFKEKYSKELNIQGKNSTSLQFPKKYVSFIDEVIKSLNTLKKNLENTINQEKQ